MLMLTFAKAICYMALAMLHLLPKWVLQQHQRLLIGLLYLLQAALLLSGSLL
ncbi:hypothetical protein MARPU_12045 [Marichromatium purpuratum 984]|uniref:Uncharacterized protein n=1 Tax=Marichromatium purpuratum 984 TaxID=765910 RepID=W0E496_MARPU|nr:hypothetical protein [Marichromatium purpuratum]AHF05572.1 hypothetical protein MARPU_12045 [Marichromatium purpuratum 984]